MILGRIVRWTNEGNEYKADPKHRCKILEYFGLFQRSRVPSHNGDTMMAKRAGNKKAYPRMRLKNNGD